MQTLDKIDEHSEVYSGFYLFLHYTAKGFNFKQLFTTCEKLICFRELGKM
jgi:hypothetical protein